MNILVHLKADSSQLNLMHGTRKQGIMREKKAKNQKNIYALKKG